MFNSVEVALDAWAECQPHGYTLSVDRISGLLPKIAARAAECAENSDEVAKNIRVVFEKPGDGAKPLFLQMLREHAGQIHFLYFWRAFSEVLNLSCGSSVRVDTDDALNAELETLRDRLLKMLELQSCGGSTDDHGSDAPSGRTRPTISVDMLAVAVQSAADMSTEPAFWCTAREALCVQQGLDRVGMEELTVIMLAWLHEAVTWSHLATPRESVRSPSPECSSLDNSFKVAERGWSRSGTSCFSKAKVPTLPVFLHIYDVSQEEGVRRLNKVLAHRWSPLKFGGVFHAGVEVNGLEWSFGYSGHETVPGISCVEPRTNPQHSFRQTVQLRSIPLTGEEVADIITQLIEDYPGDDYDILRRNCCHFADDFSRRIGAGRIPRWVHRLARLGAGIDGMMQWGGFGGLGEATVGALLEDDDMDFYS